jgi:hypothetical protein
MLSAVRMKETTCYTRLSVNSCLHAPHDDHSRQLAAILHVAIICHSESPCQETVELTSCLCLLAGTTRPHPLPADDGVCDGDFDMEISDKYIYLCAMDTGKFTFIVQSRAAWIIRCARGS